MYDIIAHIKVEIKAVLVRGQLVSGQKHQPNRATGKYLD